MHTALLIIDPQNDFCDPSGALAVPNAPDDCKKLAHFIQTHTMSIDAIYITMDTHHLFHIAHPLFWLDNTGAHPKPFTIITYSDIQKRLIQPSVVAFQSFATEYIKTLERKNRYQLCIWPPHCLIGTWGHLPYAPVQEAIHTWELAQPGRTAQFFLKGSNCKTEHYSAIRAEVPDPEDSSTDTNTLLLTALGKADRVFISGEALSHCVANTIQDCIDFLPPEKIILLTDTTSPVPGFEQKGEDFLRHALAQGITAALSSTVIIQ